VWVAGCKVYSVGCRVWGEGSSVLGVGYRCVPTQQAHLGCMRYLAHKNPPPPRDHHRPLGIVLLYGPMGGCFL